MSKLIVTRKKQLQAGLVKLLISVDGTDCAALRSGQHTAVDLGAGQHTVVVGGDLKLRFDDTSASETHVEVWISSFNNSSKAKITSQR